ncbi:MAG TPA: TlpA disulfide reductase family protein [Candidatus Polarisedimenticolia bacterium]|nr:TlpA disulfide reductase family protein [Candidatus Polarisedimenticolia bacterium]
MTTPPASPARRAVARSTRALLLPALVLPSLLLLAPGTARAQKIPAIPPSPGHKVGSVAHDFVLKDLNGQKFSLKEMRGQRVVHVVFWATWCAPCLQEIPHIRETYAKYRDRGFQVLGIVVEMNQTPDVVRGVARDLKVNYPVLWDEGGTVQDRYRVSYIPQNFLVGKDGIIRYAGTSLPSNYDALVESLLKDGDSRPASR